MLASGALASDAAAALGCDVSMFVSAFPVLSWALSCAQWCALGALLSIALVVCALCAGTLVAALCSVLHALTSGADLAQLRSWIARSGWGFRFALWLALALDWCVRGSLSVVRLVGRLCGLSACGDGSWSADKAARAGLALAARTECGGAPLGFEDRFHEECLRASLADLRESEFRQYANSFPLGRVLQKKLCVEAAHRRLSSRGLCASALPRPLFVVSLPRSGSTWLHQLLALDPSSRCARAWELQLPTRCSVDCGASRAERAAWSRKVMEAFYDLVPQFKAIHHVRFDEPDECVTGFVDGLYPEHFCWGLLEMPRTHALYTQRSVAPQYRNYRRLLQAVLADEHEEAERLAAGTAPAAVEIPPGQPPTRTYDKTVLKSPHHLLKLEDLVEEFPNAVLLFLHRDPADVVGSCCSMNQAVLDCVCPWFVPPAVLGERTLRRLGEAVDSGMDARARLEGRPGLKLVDLALAELKQDPEAALRRVYRDAGLRFSDAFAKALRAELERAEAEPPAPKHAYSLLDFGLDRVVVAERFARYNARHLKAQSACRGGRNIEHIHG